MRNDQPVIGTSTEPWAISVNFQIFSFSH